jgi:hypothetical protein
MAMRQRRPVLVLLVLFVTGLKTLAQVPEHKNAKLPMSRIVLYSSGVGYFQREGLVDGNAHRSCNFTPRTSMICSRA